MNTVGAQEYLSLVSKRLEKAEFHINQNIKYDSQVFELAARRTTFKIERGGFFTTFFVFAVFDALSIGSLREFSSISFRYSNKASGFHPPRGLLYSLSCFPVAITYSIEPHIIDAIRKQEFPMHWSASEKLVLFSLETSALYYSEKNPVWGSMYHDLDRLTINEILSMSNLL